VILGLDQLRLEAAFEQAAAPTVTLVEALRVRAVHEVHAGREALAGRLDDQVVMRAQEAARVDAPGMTVTGTIDEPVELCAIVVVAVEAPLPVARAVTW
jgi:hypothetical protein